MKEVERTDAYASAFGAEVLAVESLLVDDLEAASDPLSAAAADPPLPLAPLERA